MLLECLEQRSTAHLVFCEDERLSKSELELQPSILIKVHAFCFSMKNTRFRFQPASFLFLKRFFSNLSSSTLLKNMLQMRFRTRVTLLVHNSDISEIEKKFHPIEPNFSLVNLTRDFLLKRCSLGTRATPEVESSRFLLTSYCI